MGLDEAFLRRIDPSGDVGNDEEKRASQSGNSLPLPVKADARDLYNDRQSHQQVVKVLHGESFQNSPSEDALVAARMATSVTISSRVMGFFQSLHEKPSPTHPTCHR